MAEERGTRRSTEDIFASLEKAETATVATHEGARIRMRQMHHAPDKDLSLYFATMKGDPKTLQLAADAHVSVLVLERSGEVPTWSETEISGVVEFVRDEATRQKARDMLKERSPVVKNLVAQGSDHILDWLVVRPRVVKHRVFGEIVQGLPPTVITIGPERARSFLGDCAAILRGLRNWYHAARVPFLVATLLPVCIGLTVAYFALGSLSWPLAALTVAGALSFHLGANLLNDYMDHLGGSDEVNTEFTRPFSGGSRVIQLGLVSPAAVLVAATAFLLVGSAVGIGLAFATGPWLWAIGGIGMLSVVLYSLPRVGLVGTGVGEIVVGLNFGPLMASGAYYVQTGALSWEPVVASIPVAGIIALVLFINEFLDVRADAEVRKRTLVVRLGPAGASWVYLAWSALICGAVVFAVHQRVLPRETIGALVAAPFLLWGGIIALRHAGDPRSIVPACGATVVAHVLAGGGVIAGYFAANWGVLRAGAPGAIVTLTAGLGFYLYINQQRIAFERARRTFSAS